ncbi:hypothetical protein EYF80_046122 [Liparis tanakae]|uniref:Uncharacterized protein n=1 Tax=Liparis tanakae TaxID=230148 RepID=A0A4Z2FR96_9TELE|nr:hypothetical protein EYF80_046122 [Liparis tanakae]
MKMKRRKTKRREISHQRVNRNQATFGQDKEQMAPEKPNGVRQPRPQLEACRPLRGQRTPEQMGPVVDGRFSIARCNALPPAVQPEPVAFHQLTSIEEPKESPQEKQMTTLKNFAAQLKTLSMAIHTSQVEIKDWERLDVVHKRSQQFNSEKSATMRECDALKKQVRVLLDKSQNHSMFQNLLRTAKEEKEQMASERDGLMQRMEEQQEKLRSFQQLKFECEQARHENVEFKENIKVLEFQQEEFALEEALFNRSTAEKEAMDQENLALKRHLQELQFQVQLGEGIKKINLAVQVTVAEAHLQNEDLQKKVQLLNQRLDEVKGLNNDLEVLIDLKRNYKALKPEKAALIRQNKALQKNVRVLEKKVSQEQTYAGKNAVLQLDMVALNVAKDTLQEQVTELSE